ncbi:leukotriene A-4 hydrolase [Verticillium alfalfae VaMs.102]|uniref:Leukotriene A-4 hydrolase n=1 Tax=Verticillium alfalfae (strain VaMs.102 / ATCC MYA-4576 / FGSC 10136) TaxID=526221 RepID=C9S6B9_VERA1|nr:leukotriene A-4 hydrolase [Verticillium alfalfae VaMs.102]EEY14431.1 leukotriene A-4 hydrolase [Verticillium alfalfae VaMs.102]
MAKRDPATLSNYNEWITKHTTANLSIDFKEKILKGKVCLELESLTDRLSKEIILDSSFVKVSGVKVNQATSQWDLKDRSEPFGSPLHVSVPEGAARGDVVRVEIDLETTSKCTAVQFLTPAQTSNKKHPYMFTQCQAIHARSLFPCQDTPDVKSTYTFKIQSSLAVIASGVKVEGRSFPYGGMENPVFTYATPTLISGDRQNVDVIAHELSHSWSGNLVSCSDWQHFWLNEGWTIYLERRIGMAIHGDAERDFSAIIGWKALEDAVDLFGHDHEFTKLVIEQKGIDPDDAFSTVPYEKGFHFLYYLEKLVGRESFDKFIPHYFTKWARKSLDSFEFKATFLDFFNGLGDESIKNKVASIDWDAWFYKPGLPPKPEFDTSRVDVCYKLADNWKSEDFEPSPKDVEGLTGNQKLVFLEAVEKFDRPLTPEKSQAMGKAYALATSQNAELKSAYYKIALQAKDTTAYQGVTELLGVVGRMKYVRPLYRALNKVDRDLALKTFEKNRDFYHPICKGMVEKDLGLA